jgi:hypothetical protein
MAEAGMSKENGTMSQGTNKSRPALFLATLVATLLCGFIAASGASAAFGIEDGSFQSTIHDQNGDPYTQAGGHPFGATVKFKVNSIPDPNPGENNGLPISEEAPVRNVNVELTPGLLGSTKAVPVCAQSKFLGSLLEGGSFGISCGDNEQVGKAIVHMNLFGNHWEFPVPVYNLEPGPGQPAMFGFIAVIVPVYIVPEVRSNGDYGLNMRVNNMSQVVPITGADVTFWGVPASSVHDEERGHPMFGMCGDPKTTTFPVCPSTAPEKAFVTTPVDCQRSSFDTGLEVESWEGHKDSARVPYTDGGGNQLMPTRCDRVPFEPKVKSSPTTDNAETATGLDFELTIPTAGIENPKGLSSSHLRKAVVRLPEGVTVNPSAGEGLGVCTEEQFALEGVDTVPGAACPNQSKLGNIEIETPLLNETLEGAMYLAESNDPAKPGAENPFDSLISVYIAARSAERGVMVKVAGDVDADEKTGQLVATFDNLPRLPMSSFKLKFREGARAPLVSAATCGTKTTEARLTPWSATSPDEVAVVKAESVVSKGVGAGACPPGGVPPFNPGFSAGATNNNAGSESPLTLRLTRQDGEQAMTKFSALLPKGVTAKLAGVAECSEADIAKMRSKTGREELAGASCPASSQIGRLQVGAGVGSVLTYVQGKMYLAGPHAGAPLSVIVNVPAVIGPFDLGNVVTREVLTINPKTAEVTIDGELSDPIPHILQGFPLKFRDLRIYVDRPGFTRNPTSCDPVTIGGELFGTGADLFSAADDVAAPVSNRYQAAGCGNLGFKPRMSLSLEGGTKRGQHPSLRAVLRPRPGNANLEHIAVTLPHSAFLEQANIRTVCTRVQYRADNCPAAAIYGQATAWTPLLDEPLTGPVYLRSSDNPLPDLVVDMDGRMDVEVSGRIDSFKQRIRTTFEGLPDVPVTKFVLNMQGGKKKGLIVNSSNLCVKKNRANLRTVGQNGKLHAFKPLVKAQCKKRK